MSSGLAESVDAGMVACHDCGHVLHLAAVPVGSKAVCNWCGATIFRNVPNSVERALALYVGAACLFPIAVFFPFLTMQRQGLHSTTNLIGGAWALYEGGVWPTALIVFLVGTLAPLIKIVGMLWILVPLYRGTASPSMGRIFRRVEKLHAWSMMEVYLLAIGVTYVKLAGLATVLPGPASYAFVALILLMIAADANLDPRTIWDRLQPQAGPEVLDEQPGTRLAACEECAQLQRVPIDAHEVTCVRCGEEIHRRKPDSLTRTAALTLTACILYIPANALPVMAMYILGSGEPDTILSGVELLVQLGDWPIALLIFFASITVPALKLIGLVFLMTSVKKKSVWRPRDRTLIYRIVEGVGRWSMVDVFVVALLSALVQLGFIASVIPGAGVIAFALVVVITIFASLSFDPRLIWDVVAERTVGPRHLRV